MESRKNRYTISRAVKRAALPCALSAAMMLSSCGYYNGQHYADEEIYADVDIGEELGISLDVPPGSAASSDGAAVLANYAGVRGAFPMKVYDEMYIYENIGDTEHKYRLGDGELIGIKPVEGSDWVAVYSGAGALRGYARDGFSHSISMGAEVYAELPVEYGTVGGRQAYSHLVDVSKYFNVYFADGGDFTHADSLSEYDMIVAMKLSTPDTTNADFPRPAFYESNICMLQYDVLPKLAKAAQEFKNRGYIMIIFDAYRPTSVQWKWYEIVGVHKWVANPTVGLGGVHDRGTAVDISLVSLETGRLIEMPTAMHTFSDKAARSAKMTDEAAKNVDILTSVMVQVGFGIINSEWWHFQDVNTAYYLPTDHPLDEIPRASSEPKDISVFDAE